MDLERARRQLERIETYYVAHARAGLAHLADTGYPLTIEERAFLTAPEIGLGDLPEIRASTRAAFPLKIEARLQGCRRDLAALHGQLASAG
jgi:hypothetical protein